MHHGGLVDGKCPESMTNNRRSADVQEEHPTVTSRKNNYYMQWYGMQGQHNILHYPTNRYL